MNSEIDPLIEIHKDALPPALPDDATAPLPDDLPEYDFYNPSQDYNIPPDLPPPPSFEQAINDASEWANTTLITDEEALDALGRHIDKNFCWGKGPMDNMKINSIEPSTAYKYSIHSWNERRKVDWQERAYLGGIVDGPFNGPPPGVWEVYCDRPDEFKQETYHIPLPHTDEVRICWRCQGFGRIRCSHCHGMGHTDCSFCKGGQQENGEDCSSCQGGRIRCSHCHGNGHKICHTCDGSGKLIHFLRITVDFKDHDDDYIYEKTDLPDKLIDKADGLELLKQNAYRIGEIVNFPVQEINHESRKLIHEHLTKWPEEACHQQKHKLTSVPVNEIRYEVDGEPGKFWVYGTERNVFTLDYPAQCCCCCLAPGCWKNCACMNKCSLL